MLTIRKIRIASGDDAAARRTANYVLAVAESPGRVARALDQDGGQLAATNGAERPTAIWMGSPSMLDRLAVREGATVEREELALALQGRNAVTGERLRTEGLIQLDAVDDRGRPIYDKTGRRRRVRVRGTKSVDLTFSAPKSVSVAWSQAGPRTRAGIEAAMLAAAGAMLENMTLAKPVVAHRRALFPAHGFAAAAALHVMARASHGEPVPSPQLHVHGIVLGVERSDGFFASPELSGMFKYGAPLEGGAVARAKLAEAVVELGFEVVQGGRFFELAGVPDGLLKRMSGRTRDVEAKVREREASRGRSLSNLERSVAALQTRMPKSREASLQETIAAWRAHASEFGFDRASVEALRTGTGFANEVDQRHAAVRAAVAQRGGARSIGEMRAAVFECAAGQLTLDEAYASLGQLTETE